MKIAVIIGSTGMVGVQLLHILLASKEYSGVISFVRNKTNLKDPKLTEHVIKFDKPEEWADLVKGDVLFSCMGTTLADAGSKENQYKVDYTYQYNMAEIAAKNEIPHYVLISSAGANPNSKIFYSRMKGELDEAVQKLPFKVVNILRPGQLYGFRKKKRKGELTAVKIMLFFNRLRMFRKYHPIHARELAKAMKNAAEMKISSIHALQGVFQLIY